MDFDINVIFKIAGVGLIVAVLHTVLKQAGKEEQGQIVTLAGVAIVLLVVINLLGNLFETVRAVFKF